MKPLGAVGPQGPGIKYLGKQAEILDVARDDGEAVALGGGHDEAVHDRQGLASQFGLGSQLRPGVESGCVGWQDATGEALFHLAQPGGEFLATTGIGGAELENAFLKLAQGDDADEEAGFVLLVAITPGAGVFLTYSESAQVSSSQLTIRRPGQCCGRG